MIRHFMQGACLLAALVLATPADANIRVLATTSDWGALATELGGNKVDVYTATTALQDVHRVDAKPSLIARARTADLLIATGAELEVGWLPVLLQESGNSRIQPGAPGYFEATSVLRLLDVPTSVDRSMGDIHPQGNPHVQLDPRNIAAVAKALTVRLAAIDPANAGYYTARGNDFQARWQSAVARWTTSGAPLKGLAVVVIHRDQRYLSNWLGLVEVAAIEPKPGVPPSAGYLAGLVTRLTANPARLILRNAYNDPKAADWLAARTHAPVVVLPFSVGGSPEAKDLFGLFDDTLRRLLAASSQEKQ
jgi:zinc/manganese transport system substrate-binding protein